MGNEGEQTIFSATACRTEMAMSTDAGKEHVSISQIAVLSSLLGVSSPIDVNTIGEESERSRELALTRYAVNICLHFAKPLAAATPGCS
jgi:hypothetical protein